MTHDSITAAVKFTDVCLSFGNNIHILKSLNLQVARGAKVALIGRSGSGKTSLLAIASGLLKATSGKVETLGQEVGTLTEDGLATLRRTKFGMVFQHFHLLPTMTALENVSLALEINYADNAKQKATALLEAVGMGERLGHFPSQLSGGEQQRVAIARAFAPSPPLILADEPTGNLDDATSDQVLKTLFDLSNQNNATLIFVTHNSNILKNFDQVLELHDGVIHVR